MWFCLSSILPCGSLCAISVTWLLTDVLEFYGKWGLSSAPLRPSASFSSSSVCQKKKPLWGQSIFTCQLDKTLVVNITDWKKCCAVLNRSVIPYSLQPHGLWPTRLLRPWAFSRQEYWNGLPCPLPGDFPQPRDRTQVSCIAGRFFTMWATRDAQKYWSGYSSVTQELNRGFLHCRRILYQLSYSTSSNGLQSKNCQLALIFHGKIVLKELVMWRKYLQQKSLQQTHLWQEAAYNKNSTLRHVSFFIHCIITVFWYIEPLHCSQAYLRTRAMSSFLHPCRGVLYEVDTL